MSNNSKFIDRTGYKSPEKLDLWEPILVSKEEIDQEIERLAEHSRPANGRRQSLIVHPRWKELGVGPGLNPGVRVTLEVLKPGEQTAPVRHNSTQVNFSIRGGGHSIINGKKISFQQYDVYNFPSMGTYWHVNDTKQLHARLTYSNAPLLEKMNVHIVDEEPPPLMELVEIAEKEALEDRARVKASEIDSTSKSPYGTFQLNDEGAWLMPYETLINPEAVVSKALHWPWSNSDQTRSGFTVLV